MKIIRKFLVVFCMKRRIACCRIWSETFYGAHKFSLMSFVQYCTTRTKNNKVTHNVSYTVVNIATIYNKSLSKCIPIIRPRALYRLHTRGIFETMTKKLFKIQASLFSALSFLYVT